MLELGGEERDYNTTLTSEGMAQLEYSPIRLKVSCSEHSELHFGIVRKSARRPSTRSPVRISNEDLRLRDSLGECEIIRNCFDKCASLNTADLRGLQLCKNLTRLTINYSRNMTDDISELLSSLTSLEYLNLRYYSMT